MRGQKELGLEVPMTQAEIVAKMMANPRGISPKQIMRKPKRR
jgi:hypothetical protein